MAAARLASLVLVLAGIAFAQTEVTETQKVKPSFKITIFNLIYKLK
jgi:hypothetical protein